MTVNQRRIRRVCVGIGLLVPLLSAVTASAQPAASGKSEAHVVDDNIRARALFHDASVAFKAGKYEEAHRHLLEAWAIRQTYDVASSMAQTELKLQRYRDAAEHLEYCLRNFAPTEREKTLERVQQGLAEAKTHVAAVKITSNRDGAEIFVDSLGVGKAPLPAVVFVEPGKRRIAARLNGETSEQFINAEAGKEYQAELTLAGVLSLPFESDGLPTAGPSPTPVPGVASGLGEPPSAAEPDRSVQPRTVALWTGVGVTAVAAGVGLIFALKGASANGDAKDAAQKLPPGSCPSPENAAPCAAIESALSDRESANKIANISFFIAGVGAVATTTMFFVWPRRHTETAGNVRLVPIATRDTGGVIFSASF